MPDAAPDVSQAPAEPAAPASSAPPSAPSTPEAKPQLASFDDAIRAAKTEPAAATTTGTEKPGTPTDSGAPGASAEKASKSGASQPASAVDPKPAEPADPGVSAEGDEPDASKPEADGKASDAKKPTGEPSSRRGTAQIAQLTAERDQLQAEVAQLRQAATVPQSVLDAATAARLPDPEFFALEDRLKREDLTGDYLTAEEREKYRVAFQVREWSLPWYQHAYAQERARAEAWVDGEINKVKQAASDDLAPVLSEVDYLDGTEQSPVARAASWADVYRYIRDASFAAGGKAKEADLQPKLDAASGRVHDLEAELAGLRVGGGGRGRPLERGGIPGGAVSDRPDYRTASASDLFGAALSTRSRERNGRYAPNGAGRP